MDNFKNRHIMGNVRYLHRMGNFRQSAKLFLKSSELGPLSRRRGFGRVPILTRGHTLWYSLFMRTLCCTYNGKVGNLHNG